MVDRDEGVSAVDGAAEGLAGAAGDAARNTCASASTAAIVAALRSNAESVLMLTNHR